MADTEDSREKARARSRRFREANREKLRAYHREWDRANYRANREELRAYKREWMREWKIKSPEKYQAYRAKNPEKTAYQNHRHTARRRNIPFLLTFDEWWSIWRDSAKWEQRGRNAGTYCMARHGDQGAYEVGNVRICTKQENAAERRGRPFSEQHRQALAKAWDKRRHRATASPPDS
jgi:hypothetical protein